MAKKQPEWWSGQIRTFNILTNYLKLLRLKPEEQEMVGKGKMSIEDGCKRVDRRDAGHEATEKKPKGVKSKKPKKMPNQNHMNGRRNRK